MVSTALVYIIPLLIPLTYSLPYHYDKRNVRTGRVVSPGLTFGFSPGVESVRERYGKGGAGGGAQGEGQDDGAGHRQSGC